MPGKPKLAPGEGRLEWSVAHPARQAPRPRCRRLPSDGPRFWLCNWGELPGFEITLPSPKCQVRGERKNKRSSLPGAALGIVSQGRVVRVALGGLHLSLQPLLTCLLISTMGSRVLVSLKDTVNGESSTGLGTEY